MSKIYVNLRREVTVKVEVKVLVDKQRYDAEYGGSATDEEIVETVVDQVEDLVRSGMENLPMTVVGVS